MAANKASIRTHKGHFTRDLRLLEEIAAGDDVDKDMVRSIVKDLQSRVGKIAEIYDELVLEDNKVVTEQEKVMEELMTQLGAAARLAASATTRAESIMRTGEILPTSTRPPQFRVASDLKPPILTLESTPPEMRVWIEKFRSYFGASQMNLLELREQRAYFLARIEGELLLTLTGRIEPQHTIDDCIGLLEQRFLEIHPLFGRRLAWKQFKKKPSQKLADFYHQLRRIGDEAELDKLTVDEHHMFELILSCKHETELFLKLLEVPNPTLEKILATATAFEAAREIREQAVPQHHVDVVGSECQGCGRVGHPPHRCPVCDIVCHECGRLGHLARLCRHRNHRSLSTERESRRRNRSVDKGTIFRGSSGSRPREGNRGRDRVRNVTPSHRNRGDYSTSPFGVSAAVGVVASDKQKRPAVYLDCSFDNGKCISMEAIIDTGATISIIPGHLVPSDASIKSSSTRLVAANGTPITNSGTVAIYLRTANGKSAEISAVVSTDLKGPMLVGWNDLLKLGIIPDTFPSVCGITSDPSDFVDSIQKIKEDYSDVLVNSLGDCSGTIKGPIHLKPMSDALTKELVSAHVIVPCTEPTKWTSPAHFVEKPRVEG